MPLMLVLPVVIVAAMLIWLSFSTGKRDANLLAEQSTQQVHRKIVEHLTRLLDKPPAMNALQEHMLGTGEMSLTDMAANREPVFALLSIFPDIPSIVLGSENGVSMSVIRYPGEANYELSLKPEPDALMDEYMLDEAGRIMGDMVNAAAYDPVARPWYRAAIEADGPTWGAVYPWVRAGEPVTLGVSYVEPVKDTAGRTLGVICSEITLSDISDYLARMAVGKTGEAFIVENDGNLVASSAEVKAMRVVEVTEADGARTVVQRLPAAESRDPWIAAAMAALLERPDGLAGIGGMVTQELVVDGVAMEMVAARYTNRENLDWLIVTLIPEDDFLAGVKANRDQGLYIAAAAVLFALALGIFLAMRMIRPFLALVGHVQRVAGGDLDARIDLQDNREMAELSKEINVMVEDLQDRMKLRHALSLAMEVQQSLLPDGQPDVHGLDIAARSQYCDETGGDYYDYLELADVDDSALVVALGDVMGHGVAAAMLMATARGILRSHVRVQGSLGELMTHVNDLLVVDTAGRRFMTMFLGVIDIRSRVLRWSSAGHDPPFIYDPNDNVFLELEDGGGLPLGVVEGEAYEEMRFDGLTPGMILVVGTDGLWESQNMDDEQFGKDRLKKAIRELSDVDADAATIEKELYRRLTSFCGERSIDDDVTYVVVKLMDEMFEPDAGASI